MKARSEINKIENQKQKWIKFNVCILKDKLAIKDQEIKKRKLQTFEVKKKNHHYRSYTHWKSNKNIACMQACVTCLCVCAYQRS